MSATLRSCCRLELRPLWLTPPIARARSLFKINRNTPEAKANQLKWAQEQMDLEVPDSTVDGMSIADREDFVVKYIESEKAKFGREIDRTTAEAEVNEWLLKQATYAPAKTRCMLRGAAGGGRHMDGQERCGRSRAGCVALLGLAPASPRTLCLPRVCAACSQRRRPCPRRSRLHRCLRRRPLLRQQVITRTAVP